MKAMIKKGVANLNTERMLTFMSLVSSRLTNNPHFTQTIPSVHDVRTKAEVLKGVFEESKSGNRQAIALRNQLLEESKYMMSALADNIQYLSGGDAFKILSSGFEVRKTPEPITSLDAPRKVTARSRMEGIVELHTGGTRNADGYFIAVSPNGTEWQEVAFSTRIKTFYTGLKSGSILYYRICAVGTIGRSAWSDIARVTVM